ncbi:MAG: DUF47 family protein [Oscillospiraceae bacterium]|nr:DUF47 family protein [Oscillospiraceae bacterium]
MARNKTDYFQLIQEQVSYTNRAAHMLQDALEHFDKEKLDHDRQELHIIERQADLKLHDINDKLIREFITPIDREDLAELVQMIDEITDSLDEVLIRAFIYNVPYVPERAIRFCKIIVSSADTLVDLAAELPQFRKSSTIRDKIVKMNMFEEDGDTLFAEAVSAIFRNHLNDPLDIIGWSKLYEALEDACDAFEHVSDLIERIIMKNI